MPQINAFQAGLLKAVLDHDAQGNPVRKAGIMSVVVAGGAVKVGDTITVTLPEPPYELLDRV